MAVTDAEIRSWLSSNPTATDKDIAAAMKQHNVSTGMLSSAIGMKLSDVEKRYQAATAPQKPMLYQSLSKDASHQQIIDAYNQWLQSQGGRSSQATLDEAGAYLRNLGINENTIQQSGARYTQAPNLNTIAGQIAQLASAGDNAGAYKLYTQYTNQFGFSPSEFSSAIGGKFSPQQISEWAALGASGAFNQPAAVAQTPTQAPLFDYKDSYWNQVGGSYQNMFGSQSGLHVPELKEWYSNQGWNPGNPRMTQAAPAPAAGMLSSGNPNESPL